ncbi:CD247 antigen like isoform X2 [Scophthalmus maximus]|uniref:CD247 antigen like isoform X2 n=1 Tax=Scophthalmus maximus TaxID=52904 RepID=UPI0015E05EFE|nr:CD247 antigen like isoform X2 [Scophthalmus maximus]
MDKLLTDAFWTEPAICYVLDGILLIYCIVATVLLFREKFSSEPAEVVEDKSCIYQELERPKDADPYEILEPSKRKQKAGKKKKAQSTQPEEKEKDSSPGVAPPPLSPR